MCGEAHCGGTWAEVILRKAGSQELGPGLPTRPRKASWRRMPLRPAGERHTPGHSAPKAVLRRRLHQLPSTWGRNAGLRRRAGPRARNLKGRVSQRATRAFPAGEGGRTQTDQQEAQRGWAGGWRLGSAAASPGLRAGGGQAGGEGLSPFACGTRGVLTGPDPESRSSRERADGNPAPSVERRYARGAGGRWGRRACGALSRPAPAPEPGTC